MQYVLGFFIIFELRYFLLNMRQGALTKPQEASQS